MVKSIRNINSKKDKLVLKANVIKESIIELPDDKPVSRVEQMESEEPISNQIELSSSQVNSSQLPIH